MTNSLLTINESNIKKYGIYSLASDLVYDFIIVIAFSCFKHLSLLITSNNSDLSTETVDKSVTSLMTSLYVVDIYTGLLFAKL
jgi:hypothetical protein